MWRIIRGPRAQDRVLGLDTLYVNGMMLLNLMDAIDQAFDLAAGADAQAVGIQQQGDHHPGVEGGLAAKLALIMGEDRGEVECGDGVEEEVDEVALGEPVVGRGWEEVGLVGGPIAIRLGHATL